MSLTSVLSRSLQFLIVGGVYAAISSSSCKLDNKPSTAATAAAVKKSTPEVVVPQTATDSITANVELVNFWTEKGFFHLVGLTNNTGVRWQTPYFQVTFFDANGEIVRLNDKQFTYLKPVSGYVPPRGRSGFSGEWELEQFSAPPVKCEVMPFVAERVTPGAILVALNTQFIKFYKGAPDSTKNYEEDGWSISTTVSNPLENQANQPTIGILCFDKAGKLWMVDSLTIDGTSPKMHSVDKKGLMLNQESRMVGYMLGIEYFPTPLRSAGIGAFEIIPFEVRNKPKQ